MTDTDTSPGFTIDGDQRATIVRQIGRMHIFMISGGRVTPLPDGVELPVGSGYRVRVRLTPADDYTVERVMVRGRKEFTKGTRHMVYCDDLAETAYKASCFRNDDAEYWPEALEVTR